MEKEETVMSDPIGRRHYDELQKVLREVEHRLHNVDRDKQNKINPWAVIGAWFLPLVGFAFWFGVYSSNLASKIDSLTQVNELQNSVMTSKIQSLTQNSDFQNNIIKQLNSEIALLRSENAVMTSQSTEQMKDRFKGADAIREFGLRDQRMDFQKTRLDELLQRARIYVDRIETLERDHLSLKSQMEAMTVTVRDLDNIQHNYVNDRLDTDP